jgi:hypothetical protein
MSRRIARRSMIKLIAAAATTPALLSACATSGRSTHADSVGRASARHPGPAGTLTDPDLIHPVLPWKLTLGDDERATLAVLCDLIIPDDDHSPAASALGAHDFIDEWVSAPYETLQKDRAVVVEGLAWLDAESKRSFGAAFAALPPARQTALCDTICDARAVPEGLQAAAYFFDRVRELAVIAHYTTREGMADLGYVGNVPLDAWNAPPPEVLRHVGLE